MSHRIRQLEDGLAILQSSVSNERHPLLHDDLLKVKFGAEALSSRPTSPTKEEEEPTNKSLDALGTLTLDDHGEVKYFGRSAGSEVCEALCSVFAGADGFSLQQTLMMVSISTLLRSLQTLIHWTG